MEGITEGSDNGYKEFMDMLTPIIELAKRGIITEKEKSDILAAAHPAFKRLQAEKED
jgi:gamma-glutamyltranspeptidase